MKDPKENDLPTMMSRFCGGLGETVYPNVWG